MSTRVILAGGGLANSLIAWRLAARRPEVEVTLLEAGPALGGNHTWSFHATDLTATQREWMAPLIAHSWPRHELIFPARQRRIEGAYHSVTAKRLHEVVAGGLGDRVRFGSAVTDVGPDAVRLADGCELAADAVIDGRGDDGLAGLVLRWQKFLGQELELAGSHGLDGPVLMDATVDQEDGYRFIYLLPFAPDRVLVEDTRYSDTPDLDGAELRRRIAAYAAGRGWQVRGVAREERGVLPIVLGGDIGEFWRRAGVAVPRSGLRAALFHPTTGYSLPEAVALADDIAAFPDLRSAALAPWIRARSLRRWKETAFFRLLNRMLFLAAEPAERWRVLEHFYRLPQPLVERFYAGRLATTDSLRIFSGTPPVPIHRALRCLPGRVPGRLAGRA